MSALTEKTLKFLDSAAARLASLPGVVGLDGYVDRIIRIVDQRQADGSASFIKGLSVFGGRIHAAAGKSTRFEVCVQQTKLGGNGVIMANALGQYGLPLTYIGHLGHPNPHPVFEPMRSRCQLISLGQPGFTDALEFEDGKVMLSEVEGAVQVSWESIRREVGIERLHSLINQARLVALANWTSIPHMTDIWRHLQSEICPRLSQARRVLFIDLADPEFRLHDDIRNALKCISKFTSWFETTLGLNQKEAGEIANVLELKVKGSGRDLDRNRAEAIRATLDLQGVVVHPTAYAAAADREKSVVAEGPFAETPLISTGAGDHFNAGYALAAVLGGDLEQRLQLAVATSGYYVRTAQSPTLPAIQKFLREIG